MSCPDPLWGKYRGKVVNHVDPLMRGRMQIEVSQVPGTEENWAMPCVPYAGDGVGFWMFPPVGASVWVEFEGGDPSFPIWTGCFWSEGEVPLGLAVDPLRKGIKTELSEVMFDDTPGEGGFTVTSLPTILNMSMETGLSIKSDMISLVAAETSIESAALTIESAAMAIEALATEVTGAVSVEGVMAVEGAIIEDGMPVMVIPI